MFPFLKRNRLGAVPEAGRHVEGLCQKLEQADGAVTRCTWSARSTEVRLEPARIERVDRDLTLELAGIKQREPVESELAQSVGRHGRVGAEHVELSCAGADV